jgi:hypothetical protein
VHALARTRGITPPDACATRITDEHVGELRVDPSLPGHRAADRDPVCTYQTLKGYLDTRRPPLPSQAAVGAMTPKHCATIRRLAEQSRAWAVGLLNLLDKVDGSNA